MTITFIEIDGIRCRLLPGLKNESRQVEPSLATTVCKIHDIPHMSDIEPVSDIGDISKRRSDG